MLAQRILTQQNQSLTKSLERLSTGLRINRGADDPAGLIASENLRAEMTAIETAIGNAQRADQVANIAEAGLTEIASMLNELEGLVGQSANEAGLSLEEKEANQLQIDSILQTIDRVANSTSFQGVKLLNGTYDFTITNLSSAVSDYSVNATKLMFGETRDVEVLVTGSAQHGALFMSTGASLNFSNPVGSSPTFVFELAGAKGSREFTFASGATVGDIAAQINTFKSVTGVSAATSGGGLNLRSTDFGSSEFVSVKVKDDADGLLSGKIYEMQDSDENEVSTSTSTLASLVGSNAKRDVGEDVGAIINGMVATSNGSVARVNSDVLDVEIRMTSDTTNTNNAQSLGAWKAFTVSGGGAAFNLGPKVDITNQTRIGIMNVAARNLGDVQNGYLNQLGSGQAANVVDGDLAKGQSIVRSAIEELSGLRGRLGAFQKNVVGSTIRSLGVALENTSAAQSEIRDTDFAEETAELTRSQILVQAATNSLRIANSNPQNVLSLLG
jgi:flagellin